MTQYLVRCVIIDKYIILCCQGEVGRHLSLVKVIPNIRVTTLFNIIQTKFTVPYILHFSLQRNDTTWQPPQNLNDLNVGKRESTSSSRRVVLSQEQKRQVDMATEADSQREIYSAFRLYPKCSPSSYSNFSQSSVADSVPDPDKENDTQITSSQASHLPLLTVSDNGESLTYSNANDNHSANLDNAVNSAIPPEFPTISTDNVSFENTATQQSERTPLYTAQHISQVMPDLTNIPQVNNGVQVPPGTLLQNVVMDNADQYVLVTVVPEGNEETVIHIYKISGTSVPSQLGSTAGRS